MIMKKFVGGRIFKTGLAVFITAVICEILNWPAMFAVITAIVTIEPTAAIRLRKLLFAFQHRPLVLHLRLSLPSFLETVRFPIPSFLFAPSLPVPN